MDPVMQGLQLSLIGITVTFSSLAMFILIILALQRFFHEGEEQVGEARGEPTHVPAQEWRSAGEATEIAAAVAVALEHFRSLEAESAGMGNALLAGRGAWWFRRETPPAPSIHRIPNRSERR